MHVADVPSCETARLRRLGFRTPRAANPVTLGLILLLSTPAVTNAQIGGEGFLFRTPVVTLSVRGGYALASANGGIFDEITRELTLEKSDFNGVTFGADVGFRLSERVDIVFGGSYMRSGDVSEDSAYVEVIGQDSLPIVQETRLTRFPVAVSLRFYLVPRGRSIGQFAWVPSRWAPYVGAGAGLIRYDFVQEGDFVDYLTEEIFESTFESSGWTELAHVFGGFEVPLSRRSALTAEARYTWASADLGFDFDFVPIDLAGLQTTVGLSFRF